MTCKKPIGSIKVELIQGKDVRPSSEGHFNELMYVIDMDKYQDKEQIFDIIVFDNDTVDLKNGIYYIKDVWTSVFLSAAEFTDFHKRYGNNPTIQQKKKLRIPIVLIKLDVMNGTLFLGEGHEKIEISSQVLIDNQV